MSFIISPSIGKISPFSVMLSTKRNKELLLIGSGFVGFLINANHDWWNSHNSSKVRVHLFVAIPKANFVSIILFGYLLSYAVVNMMWTRVKERVWDGIKVSSQESSRVWHGLFEILWIHLSLFLPLRWPIEYCLAWCLRWRGVHVYMKPLIWEIFLLTTLT